MSQKNTKLTIRNKANLNKRSLLRLMAVQILYQYDFYEQDAAADSLIDDLIDNYFLDDVNELSSSYRDAIKIDKLKNLIDGVIENRQEIDQNITNLLQKDKNLDNVPDVMLQIIRLAAFELQFQKDTPFKVVISEYVDIAGCFYDSKKVPFANSILENIAARERAEEYNQIKNND